MIDPHLPGRRSLFGVEDEVVDDDFSLAIGAGVRVENKLRLDGRGDVVAVVRVSGKVQLGRDQFVSRRGDLQVKVRETFVRLIGEVETVNT